MIVPDASVVVELLINGPLGEIIGSDLARSAKSLIVPHLLDIEVMSAVRTLTAARRIDSHTGHAVLNRLSLLPAERYAHQPLLPRIWELRHNFTAYDATYIALAEATGSVLYTCDAKLARGHRARVVLYRNLSNCSETLPASLAETQL